MSEANNGPLAGIRILDLSRVLAGPYCTMFLGDLGAEVVEIEEAGVGDGTRGWGTADLKLPEGISWLRRLPGRGDVLIENFRPGTMEECALGSESIHAINPKL